MGGGPISGGETAAFWILGVIAVAAAIGVVISRRAVHSALMLAVVMITLAVFYGIQQAPFLMVVQIVVYTGAVLMLFLFVVMLVGVGSADSLVETIRGQRVMTGILAVLILGAVVYGLTRAVLGDPAGLAAGTEEAGGNVPWLATELFHRYVIAFEATGALLIVAVLGALVLAHTERLRRRSQRDMSKARVRSGHPTPLPGPGTFARHNAIDTPALLPDGTPSDLAVNPVLAAREERRQEPLGEVGPRDEPTEEPDVGDRDPGSGSPPGDAPDPGSSDHDSTATDGADTTGDVEGTDGGGDAADGDGPDDAGTERRDQ
ncbi:NADH-quinone oxidoreductase subunit J [Spiractinospora alimapuensis]|nr:NADH-quinone oxidoreductase subunit J [Spiractinospora alimapuensis]QVQ55030.1 NADH-quinone oxidoreductase subunit J [Spiractinospora alimapuensis]